MLQWIQLWNILNHVHTTRIDVKPCLNYWLLWGRGVEIAAPLPFPSKVGLVLGEEWLKEPDPWILLRRMAGVVAITKRVLPGSGLQGWAQSIYRERECGLRKLLPLSLAVYLLWEMSSRMSLLVYHWLPPSTKQRTGFALRRLPGASLPAVDVRL